MREMYLFENEIGHPPDLIDFHHDKDVMDPLLIFGKYSHYVSFLQKIKAVDISITEGTPS